ncbi:hypothetical protein U0070_019289 [Myodes glareolus]|uniref:CXXC motif containing zinc binding protein n=1 Tax=Myodes glareolus TaxID=447135 RepID=A0AAW0HAL4_MYOGA
MPSFQPSCHPVDTCLNGHAGNKKAILSLKAQPTVGYVTLWASGPGLHKKARALERKPLRILSRENVTNLQPVSEDFRWYLKIKCGNCGEISEKWQYIRLIDSVALKGGRGSASRVQKSKLCARENSTEILSSTVKSYNAEDNEKFKTKAESECQCHGLE